jgi:hypothetical protein
VPGLVGLSLWSVVAGLDGSLPGTESSERLECGRLVSDVLECRCGGSGLGGRDVEPLDAEARELPQRGALEPIRLGLAEGEADREGVNEVDGAGRARRCE